MFDNFTWRRGSGELNVIDKFADLARKASVEAGADVMVVLNFPEGYLSVVASTAENPVPRNRSWTPRAVAKGLALLHQWLGRLNEGEDDGELREEIDRLRAIKK
jgi:hypothetical protein